MHSRNDICFLANVYFSFSFVIYSFILYTEFTLSHAVVLPANEVEEALLIGADVENDSLRSSVEKRGTSSTAWFGPRLGRKKRSLNLADDDFADTQDSKLGVNHKSSPIDETVNVAFLLKNYPWLLVPALGDEYLSKRQDMKPRLGRGGNTWSDDDEKMIKAPPFSPRLGRRSLIPLKPRLGRAGNSPETAVFKPRLGRDPNFNEFTEYIAAADA
ncbi:PBAN-type neuropeptides-like isoform X2 [Planococcus citri]|uniref:PBAN-type neuropeptides-like isoform X2 n=1 Tax=Planococcus citri TaxID=170843 RepID=UPI0031FA3003